MSDAGDRLALLVADEEKLWRIVDHEGLVRLLAPVDTPVEAAVLAMFGPDPVVTRLFRCGVPNAQALVGGGYVLQMESGVDRPLVRVGRDGEVRTDSLPLFTARSPYGIPSTCASPRERVPAWLTDLRRWVHLEE